MPTCLSSHYLDNREYEPEKILRHPERPNTPNVRRQTIAAGFRNCRIRGTIIVPDAPSTGRPILALHGFSRNAEEMVELFAPYAELTGRCVIVPNFDQTGWPVFQRITNRARPDYALLGLLEEVQRMADLPPGPVDIFGYSGGAQLAHRFTMLYPHLVGDIQLGAAGWYTFPDQSVAFPYGLASRTSGKDRWARRMRRTLPQFLDRDITVYVGDRDTEQGPLLRSNDQLLHHQGLNRLARGHHYVKAINHEAKALGLPTRCRFVLLRGCGHSMRACAELGNVLDYVFGFDLVQNPLTVGAAA